MIRNIFLTSVIFVLLAIHINVEAQDYIYTQFDLAPTMYNPAKTGDYYGNMRIGGIYRDRTITLSRNRFQSPSFYIDSPLFRGFRKNDWIGLGGTAYQDNAGAGDLTTGELRLSLAYHLGLGKKGNNVFSIGLHGGTYWRSFNDIENLKFEDELINGGVSPDKTGLVSDNNTNFAMGLGLQYSSILNKRTSMKIGASATHFFFFNYSLKTSGDEKIPLMIIGHAEFDYILNNRISFQPRLVIQVLDGGLNFAAMSYMKYKLNPSSDFYLQPGLGYRVNDAALLLFGVGWENLKVRMAYDFTLSSFTKPSNTMGAIELGLMYTMKFNKEPEIEKAIICPRL